MAMAGSQLKSKSTVQMPTTGLIDLESDVFEDKSKNKKKLAEVKQNPPTPTITESIKLGPAAFE